MHFVAKEVSTTVHTTTNTTHTTLWGTFKQQRRFKTILDMIPFYVLHFKPEGIGKSRLAQVVAKRSGATFYNLNAATLLSSYYQSVQE
jgi:SpoVK/Ycf46/Vps4 family AAA+-type ATPase